ncbi:MAG: hypothetical protein O3A13_08830 [Proteobacteria bacterium]|nr:hypothetical protein [Pseudomonadota bacterium]MDA0993724.1 hypothetical protein [Pseudomonadota bacterium]
MFELLFKYVREDYARSELIFAGDWPQWLLYAISIFGIAAIGAGIAFRRRDVAAYRLIAIGLLQTTMLAVVVLLISQPTLTAQKIREGENTVALVLDRSSSMAYGVPESRFQVAMKSLASIVEDEDAPKFSVRHYEFGASADLVDSFIATSPADTATSIADSLRVILEEARFNPLAAIILSSDGADTSGGVDADELAEIAAFGVPVHTIGVGRSEIADDVELTDVTMPARALPGSTVSARVTIQHDRAASTRVKVYDGDELLQLVPVELGPDVNSTTAWIEITLDAAGSHQLRFSVDGEATEDELRNNTRSTLIDIADQQYRVFYYEGEPRWEYKFIRRAVGNDKDLSIATLLRVSPNKYYRQGIDSPEQLQDGFPATRDQLFIYDALIIGSVEAASLTTVQQEMIRDFVSERGGSLLMLAGPNGLGNGGWGQSAIADVLPARLPATGMDSFRRRKASVLLTPQGAGNQMLRFSANADENRKAWGELPEIADYQLTGSLKPAAITLLNAATDAGQIPLLITQAFGRGHAYILASGGTWRWQMSLPLEDQKHETFWRQLLRELVASAPENVSLVATAESGGTDVMLRAEFRDDAYTPIDDIGVTAVASHEGGETFSIAMQPAADESGVFIGTLRPPQAGTWYFEAVALRNNEPVAISRTSILHESGQAEHFGFRQNAGLLRRLSEVTGGQYFDADDLSALPDLLRYSSSGITETEYRAIWDAPAVFILLFLLKSSEWLLRRRWSSI